MSFASRAEDATICRSLAEPWGGCRAQPLADIDGTWVNVDSPFEQYTVEGFYVTRMDSRGTQHYTLHWDDEWQRWQWGTHGRLFLEWLTDDVISWVPEERYQNAKVWQWRRVRAAVVVPPLPPQPAAIGRRGQVAPPLPVVPSNYGPARSNYGPLSRHGSTQNHRAQPYSTPSNPWCMSSCVVVPPRAALRGSGGVQAPPLPLYEQNYNHRAHQHHWNQYGYHEWRPYGGCCYPEYAVHGASSVNLACGLTAGEVSDLLTRDIGPEDYDLLLLLDKSVPKPTASAESIEGLPAVPKEEFMGGECSICLSRFEADDSVASLPCQHRFHRGCVAKWLSECHRKCPLCNSEALSGGEAASSSA